jgi:hypothetical protein
MNSLNKHVPMLVFFLGLGFVIYAARTFFHPGMPVIAPIVVKPIPSSTRTPARPSISRPQPIHNDTATSYPTGAKDYAALEAAGGTGARATSILGKHLKELGLSIKLPDDWNYRSSQDGPIRVLSGSTGAGQDGFYMFSGKGKYTAAQARDYVMGYMSDGPKLNPPGPGQRIETKSEMKDMTVFSGTSPEGFSYRMIYFTDPRGSSHMVLLQDTEEGFKKNAGLINDTMNSIRSDR